MGYGFVEGVHHLLDGLVGDELLDGLEVVVQEFAEGLVDAHLVDHHGLLEQELEVLRHVQLYGLVVVDQLPYDLVRVVEDLVELLSFVLLVFLLYEERRTTRDFVCEHDEYLYH